MLKILCCKNRETGEITRGNPIKSHTAESWLKDMNIHGGNFDYWLEDYQTETVETLTAGKDDAQ